MTKIYRALPFFFLLIVFFQFNTAQAQCNPPELWGTPVHDEAKVLSAETIHELEQTLKQHEDSTSNQIAILIVKTLEGASIEEYALCVAEKWKLGQADKDNGVLLLIAIDDRKMRIEVGYGLEGPLPDATCSRIIRNEMAPNFRRGDYNAGVVAAVNAIIQSIAGEYVASESDGGDAAPLTWKEQALIGLFVIGILGIFTFSGLVTQGCAGWFLYAFLIPFYAVFPGAIFGWDAGMGILGTYLVGFPILKVLFTKMGWSKKFTNTTGTGKGWSSGSGWYGGGWGSGGGSSWGGGGGFSGGGGGFGGGGSSGSW